MRLVIGLIFALFLSAPAQAQLSGTYTVGGASPDYATLSAAVAAVGAAGVSGPVTFNIRVGTYTEQIMLGSITGASATNTVTFQAANPLVKPTIQFNATPAADYVLWVPGNDHIVFRNLRFVSVVGADAANGVVRITTTATDLVFDRCHFESTTGDLIRANETSANPDRLQILGSTFVGGRYGFVGGALGVDTDDVVISGNTFTGQSTAAIRLQATNSLVSNTTAVFGNTISDDASAIATYAAIELATNAYEVVLARNEITVSFGAYGIRTATTGGLDAANNTVSLGGANAVAAMQALHANVDLLYNTLLVRNTAPGSSNALRIEGTPSGTTTSRLQNSLLINRSGGLALSLELPTTLDDEDYNAFHSGGIILIGRAGTGYTSLADYRTASGDGADSSERDIDVVNAVGGDLRLENGSILDPFLLGSPLPEVTVDIDGTARDATWPHMGAHEPVAYTALSGTYAVGGAAPDYIDPNTAARALRTFGVAGNSIFQIRAGTYDGAVGFSGIVGVSASAQVRFEAADTNNRPTLQNSGATSGANAVVRIASSWVTLKNLDIVATAPAPIGRLVWLDDDASDITIRDCAFTGHLAPGSDEGSLVWSDGAQTHSNLTIDQNTFAFGETGLDLYALFQVGPTGVAVTNNTFSDQESEGMFVEGDGRVEGNSVSDGPSSDTSYRAIGTSGGPASAMMVVSNSIDLVNGRSGIAGNGGTALIANNRVSIQRTGLLSAAGIYATSDGLVAHNTVLIQGNGNALELPANGIGGPDIEIYGNILITDGSGAAIFDEVGGTTEDNSILASDHNLLYTTSGTLVEWEGASYTTLAAWRAASGFDANSASKEVSFISTVGTPDLHLAGSSLSDTDLIAPPITGYPEFAADFAMDADGDARDAYNPKMGADEGTPLPPLDNGDAAAGFYTVGGATPDFSDPDAAVSALFQRGMKGAVTLRIRAGTYPLRRILNPGIRVGLAETNIAGSPLEIRAANPAVLPILQSSGTTSTTNWILKLNGLDNVALTNLSFDASSAGDYGRALVLDGSVNGTDDLTINGCAFNGATTGTSGDSRALLFSAVDGHDRVTVSGSTFTNGSTAILFPYGSGATVPDARISDNAFNGQSANAVHGSLDGVEILDNTFSLNNAGVALSLGLFDGYTITGNQISNTSPTGFGMWLYNVGATTAAPGLIANNFVRGNVPIRLTGSTSDARIVHNTLYASGIDGHAVQTFSSLTDGMIAELTNNILYSISSEPVLALADLADLTASNGNVMHTVAGPALVEVGTTTYGVLADWQTASGFDARSRSFNPSFQNAGFGDLHLAGSSVGDARFAGESGTGVTVDFDGANRNATNPYIGADEASTPLLPLAGTYYVGSEPGAATIDYTTFAGALDALDLLGVSAPVTLRLFSDPAPLAGPFTIRAINGATATNRVTVISYLPINNLTNAATTVANNWVMKLDGARHLTFSDIGFDARGGAGSLGRAILFTGDVQDVRFVRSIFHGKPGATSTDASVVWASGATLTDVEFELGAVNDGSNGIWLSATGATGTLIKDMNVLNQTLDGVSLTGHVDPVIRSVTVTSAVSSGFAAGIRLSGGTGGDVARSTVTMTGGSAIGIALSSQDGAPGSPVRVVNNFLTTANSGVSLLAADEVFFAHNTVSSRGGTGALVVTGSTGVRIANNLLTSTVGGRLLALDGTAGITGSNTNGLVTSGAMVASVGAATYPSLAAFTAATGLDAQSNTPTVVFANATTGDLHLSGASVGNASLGAPPLGSVGIDIDGATRSATFTYKGADEAATPLSIGVSFSVQAFLQGALRVGPGTPMRTDLRAAGLVPLNQPYALPRFNGTPMNYNGSESVGVVPANTVDWLIVELRENPSGPSVAQAAVFLDEDGFARAHTGGTTLSFPALLPGVYSVVVKHRTHLALMSIATDLSFAQTVPFQGPSGVVGGAAAGVQVGGLLTMAAGDGDADGSVLAGDRQAVWLPQVGQSGYLQGDFNMDGNVLADDRQSLWAPNVGRQSNVPGASLTSGTPIEAHLAATTGAGTKL